MQPKHRRSHFSLDTTRRVSIKEGSSCDETSAGISAVPAVIVLLEIVVNKVIYLLVFVLLHVTAEISAKGSALSKTTFDGPPLGVDAPLTQNTLL